VGSLIPSDGRLYLDANYFIYSVEKIEPYCLQLDAVWSAVDAGRATVVTSELTLLETLVKPVKMGDHLLEALFRELLVDSGNVQLEPISRDVIDKAVVLRAQYGLKTPDAIHAATALASGCAAFVTNDLSFRKVAGLRIIPVLGIAD